MIKTLACLLEKREKLLLDGNVVVSKILKHEVFMRLLRLLILSDLNERLHEPEAIVVHEDDEEIVQVLLFLFLAQDVACVYLDIVN